MILIRIPLGMPASALRLAVPAFVSSRSRCYHIYVNPAKASSFRAVLALAVAFCLTISAPALPPANLPPVPNTVSSITPEELRMHLQFLASDELGGRYTLAPNFAIAARYLAAHLEAYGFHGAGDHGGFLQTIEVIAAKPDTSQSSLALTLDGKTDTYKFGDFFTLSPVSGSAEGKIVFVGAGISSPSQKHDDYANVDVKGKVALYASGIPEGVDSSRLAENEQGEGAARAHGAVGVLQIPPQRLAEAMRNRAVGERFSGRESVRLAREAE